MKLILRYVSVSFLKLFTLCILSFLMVYLSIDFMSKFWKLSARGVPLTEIGKYFVYKAPLILFQVSPMATLLATLLSLGLMSRNSEITVMKSCGISAYYISTPVILISLAVSVLSFAANEYVIPHTNSKYMAIESYRPGKDTGMKLFKMDNIWYFGNKKIYKFNLLDAKNHTLHGVSMMDMDSDYKIVRRIDAATLKWEDGGWILANGIERNFGQTIKTEEFQKKTIGMEERFSDFMIVDQKPEEMNFKELKRHIAKLQKMGLDYTRYVVDLLSKVSFPLVNLILPLIGIPYAFKTGRGAGIASGIGISIVIGFAYWVSMAFNISLGHAGVLPPFLAAFGSNIIFGLIGIVSIMSAKT